MKMTENLHNNNITTVMETALWKWGYGNEKDNIWRLQTEESHIIRKLMKRNTAILVAYAINSNLVYFHLNYTDRFKAMQGLRRLTGRDVYYNAAEKVIMTKTTPILDNNNGPQTSKKYEKKTS